MFNFYVVLANKDMVTDITGLPRAGANSKPQHYKPKIQREKDIPRTWLQIGKQFEDFR